MVGSRDLALFVVSLMIIKKTEIQEYCSNILTIHESTDVKYASNLCYYNLIVIENSSLNLQCAFFAHNIHIYSAIAYIKYIQLNNRIQRICVALLTLQQQASLLHEKKN